MEKLRMSHMQGHGHLHIQKGPETQWEVWGTMGAMGCP